MSGCFFTANGTTFISAYARDVVVWDVPTRALRWKCHGSFLGLSADHELCLTLGSHSRIHAWRVNTGSEVPLNQFHAADFPYWQRVRISSTNETLVVEDVLQLEPTKHIHVPEQIVVRHPILKTPNDRYVLLRSWWDNSYVEGYELICYDIEQGHQLFSLPSSGSGRYHFVSCPERQVLLVEQHRDIRFYSASTGAEMYAIRRPHNRIAGLSFDPRSQRSIAVAVGQEILLINTIYKSFRLTTGPLPGTVEHTFSAPQPIKQLAFSPKDSVVAYVLANNVVGFWEVVSG
jgi:hypothetical protein